MEEPDRAGTAQWSGWVGVRADYESGLLTLNAIAVRHKISRAAIEQRALTNKWQRPNSDGIDRRILIHKLLGLLERQIDVLEINMDSGSKLETTVLGNLSRDLDRLIILQKAENGAEEANAETREMKDIKDKLAKRIDAITKGRG